MKTEPFWTEAVAQWLEVEPSQAMINAIGNKMAMQMEENDVQS